MKVVGITSCPSGVAHTYMAAEALKLSGQKLGIDVIIETQGGAGVEIGRRRVGKECRSRWSPYH